LFAATSAPAQDRWGALSGAVVDSSGGAVMGAIVTLRNLDTDETQSARTDSSGYYHFSHLTPNRYEVSVEREGFRRHVHTDVRVRLDLETRLRHVLTLGARTESVTVRADAGLTEAVPSALTGLVTQRALEELPLNGRDLSRLISLESWAPEHRAQTRNQNTGYGLQVSIGGARPSQSTYRIDGIVVSGDAGVGGPASINGVVLGVDAVEEFSLLTSAYGAQYGRAAGGIINAVTRSGGNALRGNAFYFHRNDNLDARNFFDAQGKPELRRHQFGGSLGGPIRKDRTFFFGNYEGLRETRGVTVTNTTLSDEARRGNLVSGAVTVDPVIARILPLFPAPTGPVLGDTALFLFQSRERGVQDFFTLRLDHNLSRQDRLFGRYSFDNGKRRGRTDFDLGSTLNSTRSQLLALDYTRPFSPQILNVIRAGFHRSRSVFGVTEVDHPLTRDPAYRFVPGARVMGVVDVTGLSLLPGGSNSLEYGVWVFQSFQASDDVTWVRGSHTLSLGGRLERTHFNSNNPNRINGEYRFNSVRQFLTNTPSRLRAVLPDSDLVRGFRQWLGAAYWQDLWRLSRRFTVQAGVRHEWVTVPAEVNGKLANLDRLTDTEVRIGDPLFQNPSWTNLHPRVGFAWDLKGDAATVLRGGYGVYPELLLSQYLLLAGLRNPPFYVRGSTSALRQGDFPGRGYEVFLQNPNAEFRVERIDPRPGQPHVHQWNAGLERRFAKGAAAQLAYTGARGRNLSSITNDANLAEPLTLSDGRLFFPANATRLNPRFSQIRNRTFNADSFYHGLHARLNWAPNAALHQQLCYSFAKSIDDSSNFLATNEAANAVMLPINGDPRFNRGLSAHDVRHNFVWSGLWTLPSPAAGALRRLAGGWQMGAFATWSSGQPFTVRLAYDAARTLTSTPDRQSGQRPDLFPGATIRITGDPAQWVDPSAFLRPQDGFLGNLGRNTVPGPGLATVDLSLARRFALSRAAEGRTVEFRAEFFNLLNHTNFDLPTAERTELFTRTGVREDFARITSARPSREIQLALKLRF
jgi:hypothetical protein